MEHRPLLILSGPTGVGKTALSIMLAKRAGGEIISADSMQVYKGLDIGTAKISGHEMEGVPHHLIDILPVTEDFNVTRFQELAQNAIEDIYSRGKLPIVVGGTGFYIQALLYGIRFSKQETNGAFRRELEEMVRKGEGTVLYEKLRSVDSQSAAIIHPNNSKRVIRALEYFHTTGEPISAHNERESQRNSSYRYAYYVLHAPRERLYGAINKRVEKMVADGLEEEARRLYESGIDMERTAAQGIGYREMFEYFRGNLTLEQCISKIQMNTRHFAKRQMTWFRREKDVRWLSRTHGTEDELSILADQVMNDIIRAGLIKEIK